MTVLLIIALFVLIPAAFSFSGNSFLYRHLPPPALTVGAPIIYRHDEASTHPAAGACDIRPAPRGEFYYYSIIKYLRVVEVLNDGQIVAVAANKQRLSFQPNDGAVRKARFNERLRFYTRFPQE